MELFMRKYLCSKYGRPCRDSRTEQQLQFQFRDRFIQQQLLAAYETYMDPHKDVMDIIEEIKFVALSHRLAHCEEMEDLDEAMSMEVDILNLSEIRNFVDSLNYNEFTYKEFYEIKCGNIHLVGVPDYVFDGSVICQVSTSMRHDVYSSKIAKSIFHALGHYAEHYYPLNLEKQYTVMIYNPLLGKKYELVPNMAPDYLRRVLDIIEVGVQNIPRRTDPFRCY